MRACVCTCVCARVCVRVCACVCVYLSLAYHQSHYCRAVLLRAFVYLCAFAFEMHRGSLTFARVPQQDIDRQPMLVVEMPTFELERESVRGSSINQLY